ncbi:beta-galactosidase [Enterococcus italicus]|uniref:beta-galactosidase n=1 Tax=Enterococcus italicus TaxID=246144 RepID=UPI003F47701F
MKKFNQVLYGGDYNPNQWSKDIWQEDQAFFKKANINSTTINVFSWAKLQPSEAVYDFSELDEIIATLAKDEKEIVLATSTSALPAWMFKHYPEVGRVDFEGRRHRFGQRHNACPNSRVYQHYVKELVSRLAQRYGQQPQVSIWHVNNEYGGECYCENCEKAFRVWLQEKYGTIEALNKAWNLEFWGHTVYSWDEIVVPNVLGDAMDQRNTAFAGLSIDYRRFMSDSMLENYKLERDTIRQYDQETPITTNLMGTYKNLDYFKWAKEMDLVSWDNYPSFDTPWSMVAMTHDLMRGLKHQPFMLMEQTPSQQNWQPYNSLKKPGQMRAQSYQTMAHGADTIQFFQLRRSLGGCEKFHGAVIEHVGTTETRVFREVAQLGEELTQLSEIIGTKNVAKVGLVFDWDTYWALEYTSGPNQDLYYVDQIHHYYRYFYERNIAVEMVAPTDDFSEFELVVAPVCYMVKEGVKEAIEQFVQAGGTFVTTFMSGIVDQSDNVHLGGYPGPFRKLAGIWVEEIDALAPSQENTIQLNDGTQGKSTLLADIIHLETAESLGEYTSNFYQGQPVATKNTYGKGQVYYVGTQLDADSLATILDQAVDVDTLSTCLATKLEVTKRHSDSSEYTFVMNFTHTAEDLPAQFVGQLDILTGQEVNAETKVEPYDTFVFKRNLS